MTKTSAKIEQILAVARVLEAPLFGADQLHAAAIEIERQIEARLAATGETDIWAMFLAKTGDLKADLAIIDAGALRASAMIVTPILPQDMIDYRDEAEIDNRFHGEVWAIANKYSAA